MTVRKEPMEIQVVIPLMRLVSWASYSVAGASKKASHRAAWLMVLGLATAVTGCTSIEPGSGTISSGTMMIPQSLADRLRPGSIAIADGVLRVAPTAYTASESVRSTITDLLAILRDEELNQPGRSEQRRQAIEHVLRHRISYEQMAQRSLGTPWTSLNETERQEFVSLFVQVLRDTFASRIDAYAGEQVLYLSEQHDRSFAEVRTRLIGPKHSTALEFRLRSQTGEWLVYDVVIDGASLVGNYRAQFSRMIRDHSYAGLVETMKQRTLTVKGFEKTATALAPMPTSALGQ